MLDSAPIALPPARRALKRSASTASLPSPPRTHRRHARGRSRGSCDSDSDIDEHALLSSDEEESGGPNKKRRRVGEAGAKAADADEDAFWLAPAGSSKVDAAAAVSKSQAAPLLYRKRQAQQQVDVALVSPPPSHRKTVAVVPPKVNSAASSPPRTPKTRSMTRRAALRDSPDNPFLASPVEDSDTPGLSASSANPSPSTPPSYDKPTISLVFRGIRRTYQNPHYNHAEGRPLSPTPESRLPIDHPDYSPSVFCPPKLLFPDARAKKGGKKATATAAAKAKGRARSPSVSDDEADLAEIQPTKLNFAEHKTLDQELKSAGEPLSS